MAPPLIDTWTGENVSIAEIERELARLRDASSAETAQPNLRTSVMTHIAWVPPAWETAAEETLMGMAERHPSRTILLAPRRDEPDGLRATLSVRCFPIGDRAVCGEVIDLKLCGTRAIAPASIVLPLLISDLPVFGRWRGEPPFGSAELDQMVGILDRFVVDSAEWGELRYAELAALFDRTAVSDIAWARTAPWRVVLAAQWPAIATGEVQIRGPRAEAALLRGWLSARLRRGIRATEEAAEIGVRLGGEELPAPRGPDRSPSDLLSAELDSFGHDRVYEAAASAAT